ncbi:hypothetical protein Liucustia_20 [Acinetobacter phage Liucustia]|nr:hypothetical protein Liucustia_20 [Acinetobacter phage Liucustia]
MHGLPELAGAEKINKDAAVSKMQITYSKVLVGFDSQVNSPLCSIRLVGKDASLSRKKHEF